MKNLLLPWLFLVCFTITIYGQEKGKTTFGFKGGLNNSELKGFDLSGQKTRYSGIELYASLFSDTELNKTLNLQNELLFSWTDVYHFIEVPIHIKYTLSSKFKVFAGPKLDFILDDDDNFQHKDFQFKNFGISVEVGTQFKLTKRFFTEIRYSKSFTEQIDDSFLGIYQGKRNALRAGLGINFN